LPRGEVLRSAATRVFLTASALWLAAGIALAEPTAFVNVYVIPMSTDRVLDAQTVVVDDGVIVAIGPVDATPVPENSTVIDGTDRYLMPGLAELHAHIPPADSAMLSRVLELFAANGVTTVRGMLGHTSHLALRQSLLEQERLGPRLITAGPSLNGNSVQGPADAARQVKEQHAAGYDFLKLHPGLTRDEFDAIATTASDLSMPFAGHVSVAVGVRHALEAGQATIDHLDGYLEALLPPSAGGSGGFGGFFGVRLANVADASRMPALVAATKDGGTWNVPTQTLFENVVSAEPAERFASRAEMAYMPAATVDNWIAFKRNVEQSELDPDVVERAIELRRGLIRSLHESGARLLLGSDAPQIFNVPGFSLHRELALLVDAGLTPFDALATGTTAAAKFLGLKSGRVETGYDADLLLLDDNPLADIRNVSRIHGVMLRGRWLSPAERSATLERYRRESAN
jgi:imidazolonepropionase-like amidohydrolase